MRKHYSIFIAVILATLALLDGYFTGKSSDDAAAPTPSPASAPALTANAWERLPSVRVSAEKALDEAPLSSYETKLADALGTDMSGRRLRRFLTADSHTGEIPEAAELARLYIRDLQSDPRAGMAELERGLARIPSFGFGVERATLLLTASLLAHQEHELRELILQELTYAAGNGDFAAPISAHSILLRIAGSTNEALAGTITGIAAQTSAAVRATLAQQFVNQFSAHRQELWAALDERGIHLPSLTFEVHSQ